jgi:hypothetical protein
MGWPDHPIFGQGVAGATPYGRSGGGRTTPWPRGWSGHPQKPKKKKTKYGFWPFGGGRTTPLAMRVVRPPPNRLWGWLQPPLGQKWGGRSHPPWPSHPPISFPLFFFGLLGVAGPPPWPSHPPISFPPTFKKKKKLKFYNIFHFF